jgi:hypothetical protein
MGKTVTVPLCCVVVRSRWGELRINATTFKSYDTRSDDRPTWAKATGMKQAMTMICSKVGFVLQNSNAVTVPH